MNRITAVFLCLVLCFAGTIAPTTSGSVLTISTKAALDLCLQQVYLMHDAYQEMSTLYPTLTSFDTVVEDEVAMIGMLTKVFAKSNIPLPADAKLSAAHTIAGMATSVLNADAVAIELERSTAILMARLVQTNCGTTVASVAASIRTASLESHMCTFAAEESAVAVSPTPPLMTRPFPAPVTTRIVMVPTSIDTTGTTDVSTALTNFIRGIPDGSLINFSPSAIYRIDKAVFLEGRHNLIIDGNGCTMKYTSVTGTSASYSLWYDEGSGSDIWIRNFILLGSSTHPGVYTPGASPTGGEYQHGVVVFSSRFEVSGCTISAVWGDGFYVAEGPSNVWIHDNHVISAGRNGLSVISGSNVLAEHNTFDNTGGSTLDVEPESSSDLCTSIIFRDNAIRTCNATYTFNIVNHAAVRIDGIVVDNNIVTGSSLSTYVDSTGTVRMAHITFANNLGEVGAAGPVMYFKHVDGLTIKANVQLLSSGVLTRITDCTEVTTS